jgi:hypothetical protein
MSYIRPTTKPISSPTKPTAVAATSSTLGVIQVGSGLNITSSGILSAIGSGSDLLAVTSTADNYTANLTDCYISATNKNITITLPLGIVGKVYIIKNRSNGDIRVIGSGGEAIDSTIFRSISDNNSIICVYDDARWNII